MRQGQIEIWCICGEKTNGFVDHTGNIIAYHCRTCSKNRPVDFAKEALQEEAERNDPLNNYGWKGWKY